MLFDGIGEVPRNGKILGVVWVEGYPVLSFEPCQSFFIRDGEATDNDVADPRVPRRVFGVVGRCRNGVCGRRLVGGAEL